MVAQQVKRTKQASLNSFSAGTEAVFHLILGLFSLACIIPFIFVIIISFTSEESIRAIGYSFVPQSWSLQAYDYVFAMGDALWRSYFNSFLITIIGTEEDVGDRKYNDGKVVNTLRKFTAEDKAYMEQYDEWKKR